MVAEQTTTLLEIAQNFGVSVALVAYFLWKDYRFTQRIEQLFGELSAYLRQLTGGDKG